MTPGRRIVLALGGNAITKPGAPADIPNQFAQTVLTVQSLAALIESGCHLVITHGNGPQVGKILRRVELAMPEVYPLPLELCVADTQGGMGYMIAQCLMNELRRRGHPQIVTPLVTSVLVDEADPAFLNPTKPIGSFFTAAEAEEFQRVNRWIMREVSSGMFRRVVPSPRPQRIIEIDAITQLTREGQLVVACGGGGIPVIQRTNGDLQGVAAVIDKDLASALLALQVQAHALYILTAVPKVCIHYGKPNQQEFDVLTLEQSETYLAEGHFPPGSMGPKIEAAIQFLRAATDPDAHVLITTPEEVCQAAEGRAGTRICRT